MSYFNKEKLFADIHKEICINFKFKKKNLNKTCAAHTLQCKIQGAIDWTIINFFKNSFGGVFLTDNTFKMIS